LDEKVESRVVSAGRRGICERHWPLRLLEAAIDSCAQTTAWLQDARPSTQSDLDIRREALNLSKSQWFKASRQCSRMAAKKQAETRRVLRVIVWLAGVSMAN